MKPNPVLPEICRLACFAAACLTVAGGCSSVIGSAYLREAWLDAVEHAADTAAEAKHEAAKRQPGDGQSDAASGSDGDFEQAASDSRAAMDASRGRYATLDEAVADADRQLQPAGGLSPAARDALVAMLEAMPTRDWGVAVEEFTASLAAAAPSPAEPRRELAREAAEEPAQRPGAADEMVVASSDPVPPLPPVPPKPATVAASAEAPGHGADSTAPVTPPPAVPMITPVTASPTLAVQNPCFATRVRAWGVVDRFETARFLPGQEVIVYFELDQLAARESADGHTTRVDTSLKLVGTDGRRLHEWTFEPLEETCRARRRDYFARYVLSLPESVAAGPCRLEISVTDAVAGSTAQATLPLELQAP